MSPQGSTKRTTLRRLSRLGASAERVVTRVAKPTRNLGFPYRAPNVPKGVAMPPKPSKLGADYDTDWARRAPAKAVRKVIVRGPLRAAVRLVAAPKVLGVDRLDDLIAKGDDAPPVIFAPNHHSHLDTLLMVEAVPEPWRSKLVVAAAADYFFTSRTRSAAAALTLNALPIDREVTGRKSSDMIRNLVDDGWSLVIYPEGGRSPDGWGQEFKGGAAYLSARTGAAVVPVFIDGTGAIYGKGMKRPKPGQSKVLFGAPLSPLEGENTRRFSARIEAAVAALGDEALSDFWTARQRAAKGMSTALSGPEYSGWRRQWSLADQRKLGAAGMRRRQNRRWPDIG
ncbi:MAG: lysophospholipid acyltransferase family protein [Actinomycetota bacterium]|jgi:1-acyl-sn-glycerol-3-phosphate acyltransferase